MSSTRTPTLAAVVIALAGTGVYLGKKTHAERELVTLAARKDALATRLAELDRMKAETADVGSLSAEQVDSERYAVRTRAVGPSELEGLVERLRGAARRSALGSFDPEHSVRESGRAPVTDRLLRVELHVEITTDWPRLGVLLGQVRTLAPRIAIAEMTVRRAEEVPLLGVRLVLAVLVADAGESVVTAATRDEPLEGTSPFFLASELASGRSRRADPPWTPPRIELGGIIYIEGASNVIVNGELVLEGDTFKVDGETVKVLDVKPGTVRFQCGDHVFERTSVK